VKFDVPPTDTAIPTNTTTFPYNRLVISVTVKMKIYAFETYF